MNKSYVIIYNQKSLFDILDEIKENLNFDLIQINSLEKLENFRQKYYLSNLIFLTNNKQMYNKLFFMNNLITDSKVSNKIVLILIQLRNITRYYLDPIIKELL